MVGILGTTGNSFVKQALNIVKLPFLKKNNWPKTLKLSGESKYGFSEDDELSEDAIAEILQALETKDHIKLITAIEALINLVRNKNATDSFENP